MVFLPKSMSSYLREGCRPPFFSPCFSQSMSMSKSVYFHCDFCTFPPVLRYNNEMTKTQNPLSRSRRGDTTQLTVSEGGHASSVCTAFTPELEITASCPREDPPSPFPDHWLHPLPAPSRRYAGGGAGLFRCACRDGHHSNRRRSGRGITKGKGMPRCRRTPPPSPTPSLSRGVDADDDEEERARVSS